MNCNESYKLLLRFMCHAPPTPPDWFQPSMPARPIVPREWRFCEGCKGGSDCLGDADCQKIAQVRRAQAEWDKRNERETFLQWPLHWAQDQLARFRRETT